ncbi:MAG: hypothetical protein RLZZ455_359 [Candidatus Parcubacteria bacterium]|jgi:uncharacterized membrane protein YuzA (DUF378 family)
MKALHMVTFILVIVGAVNWGLVGLMNLNLVELLFSAMPGVVNLVYILVGASAVYLAATHMSDCKVCAKK